MAVKGGIAESYTSKAGKRIVAGKKEGHGFSGFGKTIADAGKRTSGAKAQT